MLTSAMLKVLFGLSILLVIIIAGWYPFQRKLTTSTHHHDFPIGETLATGVFLGAALLHMLPEANHQFQTLGYDYPFASLIMGGIFLFFLWFEHIGKELYHHKESSHPAFAIIAWFMLSIHSLMLGAALGLSRENTMMIMLFLAIITHKWAESLAISIQLNKSSLKTSISLLFFIIFALMTPLGIFIGWQVGNNLQTHSLFDPILLSASAGTFLYLGTLHGLEKCVLVKRCCNLGDFSFVIIGFLLMAGVGIYA